MPQYEVHVQNVVSTTLIVEAADAEAAQEVALDHPDMPGGVTVGAFGAASVDDGDWEVYSVSVPGGREIWRADGYGEDRWVADPADAEGGA